MKRNNENSFGLLKLLLIGALTVASASAAGPTNSWSEWPFKKVLFIFTNAPVCSLNGHALEQFATNLFDNQTRVYLYAESDGKVFGVGNTTLQSGDRSALFNLLAKGSFSTKGNNPYLSFTLKGKGPGTVGGQPVASRLDVKFVQTQFVTVGSHPLEEHYAEGTMSGTVTQIGSSPLKFEDVIRIRLDEVAQLGRSYINFDMTDNGRRLSGHSHGTNSSFGKYEGHATELVANGVYQSRTGGLLIRARGLGDSAQAAIKFTVTGKLESAAPGSRIEIVEVLLKGQAYGQRTTWLGQGATYPYTP